MEFWNEIVVDKSWNLLLDLKKKFDFVLIGGWAIYLLTKAMKSKDIDMIVDFDALTQLKTYGIRKNDKLKKYESEFEGTDIDIYVPYYSKLILPIEMIIQNTIVVEGFKIPRAELLLILKQQAEAARKNVVKGQKDRVDILTLLINTNLDFQFYKNTLKKFAIENYSSHLKKLVKLSKSEFNYLGITNLREIKKIKQRILSNLE